MLSRLAPIRRLLTTNIRTQTYLYSTSLSPAPGFYTEQHHQMSEMLNKIIERDINPFVKEWEKKGIFPAKEVFKNLGNHGLLGVTKPTENGGLGLDFSYSVAIAETLGNVKNGGVPMAIGVQTDMATPALAKHGNEQLKKEFLEPSIRGDYVACIGVSEPGAGSDVAGIKTTAREKGSDFVITGGKMWITSGTQADWMCCLAITEPGEKNPYKNKSLICLPMNTKGIHIEKKITKIGNNSSDTALIHFDDVIVPQANVIGERGKGFYYQMMQFQEERLWGSTNVLKAMECIISETADYCNQRKAFGRPILANQVVQFKLCELQTEIEALRSLVYRATKEYISGNDVTRLATMAKLKAGPLSRRVADSCLQYWGGMGYTDEVEVSRLYLDVRLLSIGAGADEVMMQILAKMNRWPDTYPM
ncbi:acyl-CoA dehydrogenase 6-like [Oopsacas minuta]|uniref:Acyl-CoA dehydrogenase 6-like n=1 Tax=Oopsacas minuta TaxID=111878 RepID=A0AAV7JEK6_9METZ|nr:acyl-CoA dehydrogenase 6-like [Oopsacas minuta]